MSIRREGPARDVKEFNRLGIKQRNLFKLLYLSGGRMQVSHPSSGAILHNMTQYDRIHMSRSDFPQAKSSGTFRIVEISHRVFELMEPMPGRDGFWKRIGTQDN